MSIVKPQTPRSRERGVVLLWTAFFLMLMLGFVALGIDVAKVMATRTQLQNAADAAALAGASSINYSTGALMPDTAIARAQAVAGKNAAYTNAAVPVQLLAGDVSFPAADEVKVIVRRDPSAGGSMVTHMAQVLGIKSIEVTATATAKVEPAGSVLCGIVPLGISPPPGETFQTGCSPGYKLKLPGGSGSVGNYMPVTLPMCNDGPCAGLGPTGANAYQCMLERGYCCEIVPGTVTNTQPGNMSGPTRSAIDFRFDNDTDQRQGICYSQYRGNNQRIVTVPVTSPMGNGSSPVTITGFATFFIKNRPGSGIASTIDGEFIYMTVPGGGGGSNSNTAFAIRLIK
jgi:Flp pilus assembly protein TadG